MAEYLIAVESHVEPKASILWRPFREHDRLLRVGILFYR